MKKLTHRAVCCGAALFLALLLGCSSTESSNTQPMMSAMDLGVNQTDGETVSNLDAGDTNQVDAGSSITAMDAETADASRTGPAATAGLSRHTIEHGDRMRSYLMYIPESYSQDTPAPLMLGFHENGGDMDGFLNAADFRDLAESEGFVLIYPQGTVLDGEETHWNPLLPSETNKSDVDDLGFIETLLDALSANINIDETRIYATGYSNGAGFVYGLACYLNDKIAAVAPVSGSMYIEMTENCNPGHPTSVAVFNGTQDFIRPYDGFPGYLLSVEDAVGYWTGYNELINPAVADTFNTNGVTVERSVYSGGTNGASVALFKVIGGYHVWFGFQIDGVPFNRLIWDFVSQFDTNGLRQD